MRRKRSAAGQECERSIRKRSDNLRAHIGNGPSAGVVYTLAPLGGVALRLRLRACIPVTYWVVLPTKRLKRLPKQHIHSAGHASVELVSATLNSRGYGLKEVNRSIPRGPVRFLSSSSALSPFVGKALAEVSQRLRRLPLRLYAGGRPAKASGARRV